MADVEMHPVKSSNLESIGHDAENDVLHVKFKGSGTYTYAGVTDEKFKALKGADSVGSYFHANIKAHHKHTKL